MTKHMVITAGGTVEPIDSVRNIQNTSTGSLCACIYEALADKMDGWGSGFMVHYVVSETAVLPAPHRNLPVTFYPVTDVNSVERVLDGLLSQKDVGYIIHGMAVSDYTKNYLIGEEELASELSKALMQAVESKEFAGSEDKLKKLIQGILKDPGKQMDTSKKVPSKSDLLLSLKKAPKLIGKMKTLSPDAFLVGFKLLKGVTEEELISVASALWEKNGCDLVLANDLDEIDSQRHKGILVQDKTIVGRYETKKEIAEGIAGQIVHNVLKAGQGRIG